VKEQAQIQSPSVQERLAIVVSVSASVNHGNPRGSTIAAAAAHRRRTQ
jgi:hypothetical protein